MDQVCDGMQILDELYQQLIQTSLHENRKTQTENIDYGKTYYQTAIPFKEDRILNIRYVKLPTFNRENKQYYYTVFINDIEYWRMGEKQDLYKQIIETLDRYDVDSYTIFQFGRYHGHTDPVINNLMKYYHIYNFNTTIPTYEHRTRIYKFISSFLQKRIDLMKKDGLVFGSIQQDVKRLQSFVDFLFSISSSYIISNNKKNSSYISYYNKNRRGMQ